MRLALLHLVTGSGFSVPGMVFSLPEVLFSRIWFFSSRGVSCSRWCFQFPPPWVCGSRNGVFSYLVGVLGSHIGVCSSRGCFWFPGSAGGLDRVAVAAAWVFWVPAGVFGSHTGLNKGGAASGVAVLVLVMLMLMVLVVVVVVVVLLVIVAGARAGVGVGARVCADEYCRLLLLLLLLCVVVARCLWC